MNFYEEKILPHLTDCACSVGQLMKLRKRIVPRAEGVVLEIGMGSAVNLPFYDPEKVERLYGLEPSEGMRRKAQPQIENSPLDVEWLNLPGEEIPLADNSVDTVLTTFTLCTIPDWRKALGQMRRVLRSDGQLLFLEHGEADQQAVRKWQNRITPVWKHVAGGCHLNRPIADMLRETGFEVVELETFYLPKAPGFAGYIYQGRAIVAAQS
ncbi:Ubiquinone/menaquinone biosynthesis C-methylase UbiE [Marinobacter daqiaonensis]|uniref:Ubiquinone/menaquinone biosynthesis C-methylase UbiE n=1 Tax=Marinobacter daqiaonensis TaxID=650891 RepID=A0A1I6GT22_9GAMM|nr:class I SAM-dependent methyltransferase [Marinobacter daqiaonensis]SFR45239.1 Ubiquinone/menaquinone biosynthesis C-methylase UbiE [Marinobacter daqiaonensis]